MSRQVRNIHLYLPDGFSFFFSTVEADDVIQQAKLCLPACLLSNTPTNLLTGGGEEGGGGGKKSSPPACLVRSWMGKTNKHQTSAAQRKLYFIIKWLLIRVSCSCGCFDQRQNCHRDAFPLRSHCRLVPHCRCSAVTAVLLIDSHCCELIR